MRLAGFEPAPSYEDQHLKLAWLPGYTTDALFDHPLSRRELLLIDLFASIPTPMGRRLSMAVRAKESEILRPIIPCLSVDMIDFQA